MLGFARLPVPGFADIRTWLRTSLQPQQRNNNERGSEQLNAPSGSEPVAQASSSDGSAPSDESTYVSYPPTSSRSAAPTRSLLPSPCFLACGDLLMSQSADWFRTHLPLPRTLYPRTLVIAGTMSLLQGLTPQASDGTITFEETKLPPPLPSDEVESSSDAGSLSTSSDAATPPSSLPRGVHAGPCGSRHVSFHAQHSLLLAHPGVISTTLHYVLSGELRVGLEREDTMPSRTE